MQIKKVVSIRASVGMSTNTIQVQAYPNADCGFWNERWGFMPESYL
jgi:hypothetical protein